MIKKKLLLLLFISAVTTILLPTVWAEAKSPVASQPQGLTLENCLGLAAKNSSDLQAAAKSVQIATAAVAEMKGGFWPKFDYTVFAEKAEDPIYPNSALQVFDEIYHTSLASTDFSGAGLSLTQPLYTGGKLTTALHLAEAQLKIAAENEEKAKQQLTFQVKQAFYQVWLAEQIQKVAEASYDNLERHFQKVNQFYNVGTVSKYEALRAKVQRDSLKPQVIAAQNGVKLAKLSLEIVIGLPQDQQYVVKYDVEKLEIPEKVPIELAQALNRAYQERPEIHQVKLLQDVGRLQVNLAEAGYKPTVALMGQYQGVSTDYNMDNWLDKDNQLWTCTLSVTGNFFNGGTTPAKVKGAKGNVELSVIKETKLRDQIRLEVEQVAQNIAESLETIRANQSNIELAQQTLELTQARVEAGMATTMDVMDSQLVVDQALNGYYRGIALYLTAEAKLDLATGAKCN